MNLVFNKKLLGAKAKDKRLAFMNDPSNKSFHRISIQAYITNLIFFAKLMASILNDLRLEMLVHYIFINYILHSHGDSIFI